MTSRRKSTTGTRPNSPPVAARPARPHACAPARLHGKAPLLEEPFGPGPAAARPFTTPAVATKTPGALGARRGWYLETLLDRAVTR
ncbi:hypothetical protein ACFY3O_26730 [Streptomyces sp. NPDC001046]|uniref:hypothetical protein n=1 Tax=unclassified Streptomyces TaxID=2593676 RepID=UPI0036D02269